MLNRGREQRKKEGQEKSSGFFFGGEELTETWNPQVPDYRKDGKTVLPCILMPMSPSITLRSLCKKQLYVNKVADWIDTWPWI